MELEMKDLHQNGTLELVSILSSKKTVGCKRLLRVIHRRMALITMRRFLQLPNFLLFVHLFLWHLISIGPCFNYKLKMSFYIAIDMRKFIWSNHLDLLLRGIDMLNYLTITRPGISYAISVVSQFLEAPRVYIGKLLLVLFDV
jgi:hypothetical protein